MQDEMIVDLYWKRDESAISETDREYGRYLSKIAYNILSDWEDSKETVNDTYLKAWNSMPTHKPSVLSTYLGKITRQLSIDAFRTRNRDKRKHSEYAVSLSELEDCISGSETTEQSIELKLLAEAINTYDMLSQTYEVEQKQLEAEAITLQQEIEVQERQNENIEKFIQKAHKYVGIEELDGYALRELVSAIYVDAPDKSSGKRVQHIHIRYDGLGFIPLNELMKKETA